MFINVVMGCIYKNQWYVMDVVWDAIITMLESLTWIRAFIFISESTFVLITFNRFDFTYMYSSKFLCAYTTIKLGFIIYILSLKNIIETNKTYGLTNLVLTLVEHFFSGKYSA